MSSEKQRSDPSPAATILRQRARVLADYRRKEEVPVDGREVLNFVVGGEGYALPVSSLREIQPLRKLTALPGTPDFVQGIMVVRGQVVSVVDLRVLLGLSPSPLHAGSSAIVLENETMTFSFLADEIGDIRFLPDDDLQAGEPSLATVDRRYIAGITRDCVILLDGEKLLSDPALVVNG